MGIKEDRQVLVVGGGVSALMLAARLARHGFQVTVFEKNKATGGILGSVERDGFRFTLGPALFMFHDLYIRAFKSIGLDFDRLLHDRLIPLDPIAKFFFSDGRTVTISRSFEETAQCFEKIEPGGAGKFRELYRICINNFDLLRPLMDPGLNLVSYAFHRPLAPYKLKPFTPLTTFIGRYFRNKDLQALFGMYALFSGEDPSDAPNSLAAIPGLTMREGAQAVRGGMGFLARVLERAARESGVTIRTNAEVGKILVENKKAAGLEFADGEVHRGKIVVVNAGLLHAGQDLLGSHKPPQPKNMTSSGIVYLLGVEGEHPEIAFSSHIMPRDFKRVMNLIHREKRFPADDPMFWIVNPPAAGEVAPMGCSALTVYADSPCLTEDNKRYMKEFGHKAYDILLERLGQQGIELKVIHKTIFTLSDWRNTFNLPFGAPFGRKAGLLNALSNLRPPLVIRGIQNLYKVGNATGTPTTLLHALHLSNIIIRRHGGENLAGS